MIIINGKYTYANVMIDLIDDKTREQIQLLVNQPMFKGSHIVIQPDCHAGAGCVVGFTMKQNDYIIPNIIGVDIGCGVFGICLGDIEIDLPKLDEFIKANIPSGFSHHTKRHDTLYSDTSLFMNEIRIVCDRLNLSFDQVMLQLGTLGGGNHFIEVGIAADTGKKWLFVHSGSRNFGLRIANYYQEQARQICEAYFVDVPKGMEFLHVSSKHYGEYLHAMRIAQRFAELNRILMATDITCMFLGLKGKTLRFIESVHNYIDNKGMIRKGAIDATENTPCLIPFNMRDGLAICKGKGNAKYNFSAPHGAGRVLARNVANKTIKGVDLAAAMKASGIYTTTAEGAADESPLAYKEPALILDNIVETVDIEEMVIPIYNFKANEPPRDYKKKKNNVTLVTESPSGNID